MTLRTLVRKLERNWEDYGALSALKKCLAFLLKPFYELVDYRVYRIRIPETMPAASGGNPWAFRLITAEDHAIIRQIEAMEEWLGGKLREKLRAGGLCLAAVDGDRLAGFNLVAFGRVYIPLLRMKRVFREHEAWSEQITVHPSYRRQGLASELRMRIFSELRGRKIGRLYGGTLRGNEASLRLSRKLGFKDVTDIQYLRVLWQKNYRFRRVRA